MVSVFRMFLALVFIITTAVAHASPVSGVVGNTANKITHVEPTSVVMQDENGEDALVVFYRLQENKNYHQVGFSIARSVDENGKLVWDHTQYILKHTAFNTQGIAPQPVLLNGELYLFGSEQNNRIRVKLNYNHFKSLDDLINHTEGKSGNNTVIKSDISISRNDRFLSAIAVDDQKILLTYLKTENYNDSFYFSTCEPDTESGELVCDEEIFARNGSIYNGNLNLYTVNVNGVKEIVMLTARDNTKVMNFFLYDSLYNDFSHRYVMNGRHGNGTLEISEKSSGITQVDDKLVVYYKAPHTHAIYKTTLLLSDLYKQSGAKWNKPVQIEQTIESSKGKGKGKTKTSPFLSDEGVSATQFKGRTFVFFSDNKNKIASYISE